MKLLVLGANGMVGHLLAQYFFEAGYFVTGFCRHGGCPVQYVQGDARDFLRLDELILSECYDAVINCIGVLNRDCETDKESAIVLNSLLPVHLASLTADMKTRIVHISTDCVFSGKKGAYSVEDVPDGTDAYSITKALGELNDGKNLTVRTSVVGPDPDPDGKGLLNWFLQEKGMINGFTGSVWNGISTFELARVIDKCLSRNITGLIQPVPLDPINKYELLMLFQKAFHKDTVTIEPVSGIVHNKSLIPSDKGVEREISSYESMFDELYLWTMNHNSMYRHYHLIQE